MPAIESTPEFVATVYSRIERNLERVRSRLDRPLMYAENVLLGWPSNTTTFEAESLHRADGGIDTDKIRDYVASRLHLIHTYIKLMENCFILNRYRSRWIAHVT